MIQIPFWKFDHWHLSHCSHYYHHHQFFFGLVTILNSSEQKHLPSLARKLSDLARRSQMRIHSVWECTFEMISVLLFIFSVDRALSACGIKNPAWTQFTKYISSTRTNGDTSGGVPISSQCWSTLLHKV